jgi:release factor glutamine methyltransferase
MSVSSVSMPVRQLVKEGTQRLEASGSPHAHHEAEWLLSRLLGTSRLELYLSEGAVPEETVAQFYAQINARSRGIPLQYLLGEAEFYGERFALAPGVFIPRPETEAVVEEAVSVLQEKAAPAGRPLRLLELGTGSGCIAVTLARCLPTCVVVGVELSWTAVCIAKENAERHGCSTRVRLVQGYWGDAIRGTFDGIISNPPYIPTARVAQLPRDVRHEPRLSLDGGPAGMRDLFQLVTQAERLLAPGGMLALECGEEQAAELSRHLRTRPWAAAVRVVHDMAGRPRGVLAMRKDSQ